MILFRLILDFTRISKSLLSALYSFKMMCWKKKERRRTRNDILLTPYNIFVLFCFFQVMSWLAYRKSQIYGQLNTSSWALFSFWQPPTFVFLLFRWLVFQLKNFSRLWLLAVENKSLSMTNEKICSRLSSRSFRNYWFLCVFFTHQPWTSRAFSWNIFQARPILVILICGTYTIFVWRKVLLILGAEWTQYLGFICFCVFNSCIHCSLWSATTSAAYPHVFIAIFFISIDTNNFLGCFRNYSFFN